MYHENVIYHVFNHTINRELLFRNEKDYHRFLRKLRSHLLPVADLCCYCLMPTHFHLQLIPKASGCAWVADGNQQEIHARFRTILSSYTRVVNLEYDRRGSLFRAKTKYKPAFENFIPEDWELQENDPFTRYIPYVRTAFHYIHQNPVRAGLVTAPERWPYSSAPDYAGLRQGTLCNFQLTEQLLGIQRPGSKSKNHGDPQ